MGVLASYCEYFVLRQRASFETIIPAAEISVALIDQKLPARAPSHRQRP
jgi:hypothetical protein